MGCCFGAASQVEDFLSSCLRLYRNCVSQRIKINAPAATTAIPAIAPFEIPWLESCGIAEAVGVVVDPVVDITEVVVMVVVGLIVEEEEEEEEEEEDDIASPFMMINPGLGSCSELALYSGLRSLNRSTYLAAVLRTSDGIAIVQWNMPLSFVSTFSIEPENH